MTFIRNFIPSYAFIGFFMIAFMTITMTQSNAKFTHDQSAQTATDQHTMAMMMDSNPDMVATYLNTLDVGQ